MAHVVTERCVDCRYTDCCTVCPVDCFYETESPAMLVIDPDTCIDCELCVPECPIQAIWPEDELPDVYGEWTDKNAELFGGGTMIKTQKDAMSGALSLVQIQTREQERGWQIKEPSGASGEEEGADSESQTESAPADQPPAPAPAGSQLAAPEGLTESQVSVFDATANTIYRWRTVRSVALQVSLPKGTVQSDMDTLVELGHVKKRPPNTKGSVVYGAAARIAS